MPKIIIVESCHDCDLKFKKKVKLGCPVAYLPDYQVPNHIHSKCPLGEYKTNKIK